MIRNTHTPNATENAAVSTADPISVVSSPGSAPSIRASATGVRLRTTTAPTAQRNGTARKHCGPRASSTQVSMNPWLDAMMNRIHSPAR